MCVFLASAPTASAGTVVVFTVDVESNETIRLPDQIDAVCADGSRCGLLEIVRRLRAHQWSGTFFLNVYEHRAWGEDTMRGIATRLQTDNQDVALHTHPHWIYDPRRPSMYQYSIADQTAIVRDGVRLLESWTGQPVVAHRAGAYTADERTLVALERNGIVLDSSLMWSNPETHLDGLGLSRNVPSHYGRVLEIPVTVYEREERPRILADSVAGVSAIRKIDPNWFIDAQEARQAIAQSLAADVPVLVVFLHSFSFMTAAGNGAAPVLDRHALDMFAVITDEVARRGLRVVTMRDLAGNVTPLAAARGDVVPDVTVRVGLTRYAWQRVKHLHASAPTAGAAVLLFGTLALFAVAVRRRVTTVRTQVRRTPQAPVRTGVGSQ